MATVLNTDTGRSIGHGDTVVDFRGTEWIFIEVSRFAGEGRSAKIVVSKPEGDGKREFYSTVFPSLKVEA
ncbi:hypothetical protein SEA_NEFERTHENA_28 [Microbacterium phage Neferthena]|uniref:Uncharacterized protein n=1 Tax=Microbacterium phage Neferthena TaxID=2301539 RepID=A0A385D3D9_9CAUD|nr:hypothetical protein HOT92_gp28 [Microbacterium phage Neferthena]AXQ52892.1 hypothetical protein SEA_NEFERTHENA_28 [Microbacterium phage Neferthena]